MTSNPSLLNLEKALIQRCHLRVIFVSRQLFYNHHCKIKCFMMNLIILSVYLVFTLISICLIEFESNKFTV